MQLFNAATESHAKDFASPKRYQRMCKLVTFTYCIGVAPRIQVSKNTRSAVIIERNHQAERASQDCRNQKKHAGVHAAEKQDAHGNYSDHHERTHVGFGQ